jgi:MFS transporter, PHS family, inorganic phosphate transporter
LKVILVAGVGFFTDAYDIFAISIASTMLGYVYGKGQKLNSNQDLGVKVATPVGTLVGQLFFGWLADRVGRKRMCKYSLSNLLLFGGGNQSMIGTDGIELIIIIFSTFAQALCGNSHAVGIIGALIVWRFVVGGTSYCNPDVFLTDHVARRWYRWRLPPFCGDLI